MDAATLSLLADLSASFLLLLVFGLLLGAAVALFFLWKGIRAVRRDLAPLMQRLEELIAELELTTRSAAEDVVEPPIRIASAWAGLKAGARALVGRTDEGRDGSPPSGF